MKNKWILDHPEEWKAYLRKYRKDNPSMQKKANHKSYVSNGKRWYQEARLKGQIQAKGQVSQAIKKGKIPCLKVNVIKCAYCPAKATVYEHRDYNKPLDVQPVCARCNVALGEAIPLKLEASNV